MYEKKLIPDSHQVILLLHSSFTDHVRNEKVFLRVKVQKNILHEISKRKANRIGRILCRNCLLQRVIEGKIKGGDRSDRKTSRKT